MQHLQGCAECQAFHQKQTKLRQLVGGLGMVEAPADFDLQLRRRLANERSGSAYRFPLIFWPVGMRAVSFGAAVVLIVGAFLLTRNMFTPKLPEPKVTQVAVPKSPQPTASSESQLKEVKSGAGDNVAQEREQVGQKQRGPIRVAGTRPRQSFATRDFSSSVAPVIRSDQSFEAAPFTISASQQSLKLSLDDGSGVRTISVPRVSFGSQRVLANSNTANQFASRGVW
jgi:hypothetical protein